MNSIKIRHSDRPFFQRRRSPLPVFARASMLAKTYCPNMPLIDEEVDKTVNQEVKIKVGIPVLQQQNMFGFSGFHSYPVQTIKGDFEFVVMRRFKELEWLHSRLLASCKGLAIPPLPSKSIFGSSSDSFLERRRTDIEEYLNALVAHPLLRSVKCLWKFLTAGRDEMEAAVQDKGSSKPLETLVSAVRDKIWSLFVTHIQPLDSFVSALSIELSKKSELALALTQAYRQMTNCKAQTLCSARKIRGFFEPKPNIGFVPLTKKNETARLQAQNLKLQSLKTALDSYLDVKRRSQDQLELLKLTTSEAKLDLARLSANQLLHDAQEAERTIRREKTWLEASRSEEMSNWLREVAMDSLEEAKNIAGQWRKACS